MHVERLGATMRDIAMFFAMLALVPLAFKNSYNAYLLWGWTALLSPVYYLFGFMQGLRYNLIFAAIAIGLWLLGKVDLKGKISANSSTLLLIAFTFHVSLSALFGYDNNPWNVQVYEGFVKAMFFVLMMPIFVSTRLRIHALVVVICLALGFHGVVEGLKLISSGGAHKVRGIETSMLSDNNHFAVGMGMVLPLLIFLMIHLKAQIAKYAAAAGLILTVLAIVATHSRGGFLCISVVGLWYAFTARRKVFSFFLLAVISFLAFQMAPEEWFSRIETIKTADADESFMGRVIAWKVSTAVALVNPIFGGGLHAIQAAPVWQEFIYKLDFLSFISTPLPDAQHPRAAHSIYFEILGDLGLVGLLLFISIIINAFLTAARIRKLTTGEENLIWARDLADALRLALVAYCIGGAGVSLGYLELFYVIVMLLAVLHNHIQAFSGVVNKKSAQSSLSLNRNMNLDG